MKGTPDNTVILHWDECGMSWGKLSWHDWVRFRGCALGRESLLAGAKPGEHYLLVCVTSGAGRFALCRSRRVESCSLARRRSASSIVLP